MTWRRLKLFYITKGPVYPGILKILPQIGKSFLGGILIKNFAAAWRVLRAPPKTPVWVKRFPQIACYDWAENFPKIDLHLSRRHPRPLYIYILFIY